MYKIFGILTAVTIAGAAGFYYGSGRGKTVTVEKEVVRTETRWKDRIVTVIRTIKPDGTVVEETRTEDKEGSSVKDKQNDVVTTMPVLAKYSLGASYGVRYRDLLGDVSRPNPDRGEMRLGRRILGPVWGEVGLGLKQVTFGIRYEF